jgi:hypothetical protein
MDQISVRLSQAAWLGNIVEVRINYTLQVLNMTMDATRWRERVYITIALFGLGNI